MFILTLTVIALALLLARALYTLPTRWDAPQYTGNCRQYLPGETRLNVTHLGRVLAARQAVRRDDGYVKVVRS